MVPDLGQFRGRGGKLCGRHLVSVQQRGESLVPVEGTDQHKVLLGRGQHHPFPSASCHERTGCKSRGSGRTHAAPPRRAADTPHLAGTGTPRQLRKIRAARSRPCPAGGWSWSGRNASLQQHYPRGKQQPCRNRTLSGGSRIRSRSFSSSSCFQRVHGGGTRMRLNELVHPR